MKKIILFIVILLCLTGCMNNNKSSYEQIIEYALTNNNKNFKNQSRNGYSYYLPKGLNLIESKKTNILFGNDKIKMYMYVDIISYFNKRKESYKKNDAYVSLPIENADKFGYLEINEQKNDKYLVEIMYNYAKIEVIVDACDLKEVVSYAIAILSSISYNDTVLENMIGEDILNYSEVEFNIFETAQSESNLIEYDENSNSGEDKKDDVPDTDLIN